MKRFFCVGLVLFGIRTVAWATPYPLEQVLPADAAQKFDQAGLHSTQDLLEKGARADERAKLAKATGIAAPQLLSWVQMCDLVRIKGVGPVMVKLLAATKVQTVSQLAHQKAKALYPRMMKVNEAAKITQNPPSEQHLENWIDQAKKLKAIVR